MAKIVLGMAIPHSGMLGKPGETWLEDGQRDRDKPFLWFRNKKWTYAELEAHRIAEGFVAPLSVEERQTRSAKCTAALDELRRVYAEHKPDVAIIIGKDQKEIFIDHNPSIALYTGEKIFNGPPQRAVYAPDHTVTYDAYPELATYLIRAFQSNGFDLTDLLNWPPNTWTGNVPVVPHAFGFIYNQIMQNDVPPNVPILMNTFYEPNQPSMRRSIEFGKVLLDTINAWDSDKTVAIIASGGLSHFVCDEELDRTFIRHFEDYNFDALANMDNSTYQHGTSEVKLYVPVMVAMQSLDAKMTLVDYVPCYRTEAGSGEGMGFFYWTPQK